MVLENFPGPCLLRAPAADPAPIVFDSPHSGARWPEDFHPIAAPAAIATSWDAYVDELFSGVPGAGATLLAAQFPRSYIDANRALSDIDAALLAEPWPEPLVATEYTRRGMGLIRRYALPDVPMYGRPLSVAEVKRRIDGYYRPYRQALRETLENLWRAHGAVWHVNCHSMKSRGNAMNTDNGRARPDIVVSDRGGATAPPEWTRWTADYFRSAGYTVQINDPYRGGDIIAACAEPDRRRHSLQIEINRALYMDERTCERGPRFAAVSDDLTRFAAALRDWTKGFPAA